jgi:hypothetical protein
MSKRRAVVIGINKYKEYPEIPELKGAVHDATEIATILREEGDFEIAPQHLLINEQASFLAIRQAMSDLLWRTDPCDLSLFYFSGHGFEDGRGAGYLAPYDMFHEEPFVCGIGMHELREMVIGARNKASIVGLLDCCYSGLATEGDKAAAAATLGIGHHFEDLPQGTGRTILASSGKDQKSREISRKCERSEGALHEHGIFTFHLLEGLQGKAAGADGNVSLDKLCRHVADAMKGDDHAPCVFQSSVSGDTIITTVGRREKIEQLFLQADGLYGQAPENVWALFAAIDVLGKLIAFAPDLARVRDLRGRLDQELAKYKSKAPAWLLSRQIEIGSKYPDQLNFLRSTVRNLSVEEVLKQSLTRKTVLVSLCRATLDPDAYEDLVGALDAARNEPVAMQSRPAAAALQAKGAGA